jgi:hypothetical protein
MSCDEQFTNRSGQQKPREAVADAHSTKDKSYASWSWQPGEPGNLSGCCQLDRKVFRDVEKILAERGVVLTDETIRQWCLTFGQMDPRACGAAWSWRRILLAKRRAWLVSRVQASSTNSFSPTFRSFQKL